MNEQITIEIMILIIGIGIGIAGHIIFKKEKKCSICHNIAARQTCPMCKTSFKTQDVFEVVVNNLKNAEGLEDRCEKIYRNKYVRCTLQKGHTGKHLGTDDSRW